MDSVGVDGAIFISAFSMYRYDIPQILPLCAVRKDEGRPAQVGDLDAARRASLDGRHGRGRPGAHHDAGAPVDAVELLRLARETRRCWSANPVAQMDRPPHRREAPRQVPGPAIMDALIEAAKQRRRPRDLAIFLILRYTGMRRDSVATLRVRNLDAELGAPQRVA